MTWARTGKIIEGVKRNRYKHEICICSCGVVAKVRLLPGGELRSTSCRACANNRNWLRHGQCGSPEYQAWANMWDRVRNPNRHNSERYIGRGIKVCERWGKFENFIADMGQRPSNKHSLDRFPNNDGHYEPGNCRWATLSEQQNNTSQNVLVTKDGVTKTITQWARFLGVSTSLVSNRRYGLGWTAEKALFTPIDAKLVMYRGRSQTASRWAKELGLASTTVYRRLNSGMPPCKVFGMPRERHRKL